MLYHWATGIPAMCLKIVTSLCLQDEGVRIDSLCASLSLVRMEEYALCPAAHHWDTLAPVSLWVSRPYIIIIVLLPVKLQKQLLNLLFLSQGYAGANCERTMNCKELPCYNGGSCTLTSRGARCTCIQGFGGPLCQHRSNQGCYSKPCHNGGLCTEETSFPFFHCQCINGWKGIRCEQETRVLPLPPPCPISECHGKANDGVCDKECNLFACRWDGGDCSLAANPWAHCSDPRCWRLFNNSQCDEFCNNAECLYDNFDCKNKEKVCK